MNSLPSYDGPGVYEIVNKTNGKIYIGSSVNLKARAYAHFLHLNNHKHYSRSLQVDYSKGNQFEFRILKKIEGISLFPRAHLISVLREEEERFYSSLSEPLTSHRVQYCNS